jgi:hypothetical protein
VTLSFPFYSFLLVTGFHERCSNLFYFFFIFCSNFSSRFIQNYIGSRDCNIQAPLTSSSMFFCQRKLKFLFIHWQLKQTDKIDKTNNKATKIYPTQSKTKDYSLENLRVKEQFCNQNLLSFYRHFRRLQHYNQSSLVSSTTTPPPLPSNTKHIFNIDLRQNDQRQPELLLQTTTNMGKRQTNARGCYKDIEANGACWIHGVFCWLENMKKQNKKEI